MVLRAVLGDDFNTLPEPLQTLHAGGSCSGHADILLGNLVARILTRAAGFPPAGRNVPVRVLITANGPIETWIRDFGSHRLKSVLQGFGRGRVVERFGLIDIIMKPHVCDGALHMPVVGLRVLGVPVPAALLRGSGGVETGAADGTLRFDVASYVFGIGLLIRYAGMLGPDAAKPV